MKKSSSLLTAVLFVSGLLLLSGCVATIGNRQPSPPNVTLGQQLLDLQKARDAGVINEAEFQAQREKFLARK